jgi:hypothetical protein
LIYSDSRYADGIVLKALDARSNTPRTTVYRRFPSYTSQFFHYTWVEGDRIEAVATDLLGSPDAWWRIMDLNPEVIDPFEIPIGTVIRVPRG